MRQSVLTYIKNYINEGHPLKNLKYCAGVSFTEISQTQEILDTISPQHKAWITNYALAEQNDYRNGTAGQKAAMTRWYGKAVSEAVKPQVVKAPRANKTTKTFKFTGEITIQEELLKYLHLHPNGKQITFAKVLNTKN